MLFATFVIRVEAVAEWLRRRLVKRKIGGTNPDGVKFVCWAIWEFELGQSGGYEIQDLFFCFRKKITIAFFSIRYIFSFIETRKTAATANIFDGKSCGDFPVNSKLVTCKAYIFFHAISTCVSWGRNYGDFRQHVIPTIITFMLRGTPCYTGISYTFYGENICSVQ